MMKKSFKLCYTVTCINGLLKIAILLLFIHQADSKSSAIETESTEHAVQFAHTK